MYALLIKNLIKIYANRTIAVNDVSLEVPEGDFFALLGQNGAGKSSIIGIISYLIVKTKGSVSLFGYDLDCATYQAKSMIGIMPQEINFGGFETVINTLLYQAGYYGISTRIARQRAKNLLTTLNLWEYRDSLIVSLSGGMKRRLMLARALINNPRLLILDEPTAGVDVELRHLIWNFLQTLNTQEGTTVILTTHYLEEAEHLCKNLAILDQGKIIARGSLKEFLQRLNEYTIACDLTNPLYLTPHINGYEVNLVDCSTLEIKINKGQSLNELFALLNQQQIIVHNMRNKTNRLEELFINMINKDKTILEL